MRGRIMRARACILADAVATSYHAVVQRAQARPGMTVALVGVSGVGPHALQMARLAGARTVAVDINDARLSLAGELGRTSWQELADTMALAAQGRVTPVVDRVFALAEVESAFESLCRGEPLGRNVLAV